MKYIILILIPVVISSCFTLDKLNLIKAEKELVKQANAFGQLYLKRNAIGIADQTYPKIIKIVGRDKLIKDAKAYFEKECSKKSCPDSVSVGKPNRIIAKGDTFQTTLPFSVFSLADGMKQELSYTLVAISENKGKTWHFIFSSADDLRELHTSLPIVDENLIIPNDSQKWLIDNTPQNNYRIFWYDFKNNYPAFQVNNIYWDSVYTVYYPKIKSYPTYDFFNILNSSFLALKDAHSGIISSNYGTTNYYSEFIKTKPDNFSGKDFIKRKYISALTTVDNDIFYGAVKDYNIGYLYMGGFGNKKDDYLFIDEFIKRFKHTDGIIIDVRHNGGGDEYCAQIVASRFINKPRTYRYARFRNGPDFSDLSNSGLILEPGGKEKYLNTIVLLTNRRTFSAAEDFTLMLKSMPHVIQIGDTTFGGVATRPIVKTLPNGWTYRMSTAVECDIHNKPIKGGIIPDISVQVNKNGLDKDGIIEKAVKIIETEKKR